MNRRASPACAPIYPIYCHAKSPTIHKWLKLTAVDVHALQERCGYSEENSVYFHLNHPVRYVYLCGAIVSIDFFPRIAIVCLDDSSGQTINVKIDCISPPKLRRSSPLGVTQTVLRAIEDEQSDHDSASERAEWSMSKATEDRRQLLDGDPLVLSSMRKLPPDTVDTCVKGIRVTRSCKDRACVAQHLTIGDLVIQVGTVIKAKGTLGRFRDHFQLHPIQISTVETLREEMRIWKEYADFCNAVLGRPWQLSLEEIQACERLERARAREQRRRDDKAARHQKHLRLHQEAQERRWADILRRDAEKRGRRQADEERKMNGNALDRIEPVDGR